MLMCGPAASAQEMFAPKVATPVTAAERAKMDRFVGTWTQAKTAPDGLKTETPYPESDTLATGHLQPWAKALLDSTEWDVDDTGAVCKRDGIFRQGIGTGFAMTLVRSKDKLISVGSAEEFGARDIFMDSPHPADLLPTWDGDARAHFEGDTLVIDTVSFNDKSWLGSDRIPHTEELHVIEYLTLHHNGKYLTDRVIVDDRKALTTPFTYLRVYQSAASRAVDKTAAPSGAAGAGGGGQGGGEREEVCNQERIGRDPWRRKREAILEEHQEQLDAFVKQTLQRDSAGK
jgi:hypothetical protein